jgi:hypothetical protein
MSSLEEIVSLKSLRSVISISIAITIISFGIAIFFLFQGPEGINVAGKSLQDLVENGDLIPIIVIPLVFIFVTFFVIRLMRSVFPPRIKNGVTASARVLEVRDSGVSVNDNPQVELLLEVTPKDRAPFQARARKLVPRLNAGLVQPGISAQVIFDPLNPDKVRIVDLDLASAPGNSAESRLRELDRLYEARLITGDEYRAKRDEIIKDL